MATVGNVPPRELDPGAVLADKKNMGTPEVKQLLTPPTDRGPVMGDVVVSLNGVSKRYGPIQALEDVALELRAGEVHCLAGENGAGKSTLIKILTGAVQRDEGSYEIEGREIGNPSPAEARDAGIGVVYQELSLLPDLSVGENLLMGRLPARRGVTRPGELRKQARADARARRARLARPEARRSRRPRWPSASSSRSPRCSGQNPRVLIFDEPTTALSESETKALLARIHGLRDEGHAVMYVSHHLEEMFEIGDRVTILRDGKFAAHGADGRARPRRPDRLDGRPQDREPLPARRTARSARRGSSSSASSRRTRPSRSTSRSARARSSASRACSAPAAASCCGRCSAPTRSTAATSRSTASGCRRAARAARSRPASAC